MHVQTQAPAQEPVLLCGETKPEQYDFAETILFVEDEAFVREATCEILRSAGYTVLSAKNVTEAAQSYYKCGGEIDLLLTDVVLPGETGPAFAGRLKQENPALRILFVTGYAEQMGMLETEREELLSKPFSTETLLGKVRQLLSKVELPVANETLAMPAYDNA